MTPGAPEAAQDHRAAWLRLALAPGIGPAAQRALLAAFGLPEQIFAAGRTSLAAVVGGAATERLLAPPDARSLDLALAWAAEPGHHLITLADAAYPASLLEIADPPVVLYVAGEPTLLAAPALAIVGARSATTQGVANAEAFARSLAQAGLTVISGLAQGIDAAAHRGALAAEGGRTIAVIGTGADRVYPAAHRALAHEIAARGAIVSEFPLGTAPLPHNFPRRNRIIAGLARGVLVVEAALNSGSLITAQLATECGREVLAIPGSIHSPLARGCHRLIRDGAKLVETARDVLEELRWLQSDPLAPPNPGAPAPRRRRSRSAEREEHTGPLFGNARPATPGGEAGRILDALGHDPVDVDTLAGRCGLTPEALYAILLPLELDGHVGRLPGGRFQRT